MFEASSGGTRNTWAEFAASRRGGAGLPGSSAIGTSDDTHESMVAPAAVAIEPAVVAMVKKIAGQLSVSHPRRAGAARRGAGEVRSVPYGGGSDDIDLDQTLEKMLDHPIPSDRDIIVRERIRMKRAVVLAVDLSGSMKGERIKTAAAAVGALAGRLTRDDLAVLAFWSDAAWLVHLGEAFNPDELVGSLLEVPARGLTNLAFPLELAGDEVASSTGLRTRVILLSDCVHNAGPDPRSPVGRLPRLDILLQTEGQHDRELASELAHLGRGRVHAIQSYLDVAPALTEMFSHD